MVGLSISNSIDITGRTDLAGQASIFQDAAVAYSLRDLGLGTENVVRVRRSLDNVEQDFSASEITDGTLTTFCGIGDGFVSVWYNQTGGANAIQPTASSQPRIVNTGVLETKLGKPAIYTTQGINLFIDNSSVLTAENGIESYVVFSVDGIPQSNRGVFGKWGGSLNEYGLLSNSFLSGNNPLIISRNTSNVQTNTQSNVVLNNETTLLEAKFNEDKQIIFKDTVNIAEDTITDVQVSDANFSIGSYEFDAVNLTTNDSYYQDFIVFQSLDTGKQSEIRNNINGHYAIY